MKIIRLNAENFMRLNAVEITPQGNTVLITGKNGQGKSSVLEAIMSALCGKRHQPKKPIKDGEDSAEIVVQTENWVIKRTFTAAGGGSITITNKDGMRAQSPQALLDKIVGKVGFDPMLFIRLGETATGEREQLAIVMRLAGLDFSDIDAKITTTKTDRSSIRTDKERYEREARDIAVAEGTPDEEVSVVKLAEKLQSINAFNEEQREIQRQVDSKNELATCKEEDADKLANIIGCFKEEIEELENKIKEENLNYSALADEANDLGLEAEDLADSVQEVVDPAEITTQISTTEVTNADVRLKKQKAELLEKAETEAEKWRFLGKKTKNLEAQKATRLSDAKMPLEGMSVTEDGVMILDEKTGAWVPLSQVNDAEKLKVGMGIAMALNPELRVILMKGNDLDEDSLKLVSKMAKDKDYMVWIERIEGEGGIVIEDGSVKVVEQDIYEMTERDE